MRAMSAELERHQSGLGGVGEARDVVLRSEVPMEAGDGGGSQATAGAMELEAQIGASSTVGDEPQGTSMDGRETAGEGGGRRKRSKPWVHRVARSGQHKKEGGRHKRGRDGREG